MFGLMQPHGCSTHIAGTTRPEKLHYCGTCKTLGREFGLKSRLFLNWDAVFLGEFLSRLSGAKTGDWASAYHESSCLAIPSPEDHMPAPLRFSSAVNMVMAQIRMQDGQEDGNGRLWKWAESLYARSFEKAWEELAEWGISRMEVEEALSKQQQIERKRSSFAKAAETTGILTGLFFRQGAARFHSDREVLRQAESFGSAFGKLIYGVDAVRDLEADRKSGSFNPLIHDPKGHQLIGIWQAEAAAAIQALPLPEDFRAGSIDRLAANCSSIVPASTFNDLYLFGRWQRVFENWKNRRITYARAFAEYFAGEASGMGIRLQKAGWTFFAFAMPGATEFSKSPQESGSAIASWISLLLGILAISGLLRIARNEKITDLKKQTGSCCDGCCSECCSSENCGCSGCGNNKPKPKEEEVK
jgi:hypothetical protein